MPFLTVFGHTVIDQILCVKNLPAANSCTEVLSTEVKFGGTGANIARWAAHLGMDTALFSLVGEDMPLDFENALRKDGVNISNIVKVKGAATPTWKMYTTDGNQFIGIMDQGPYRDHMPEVPVELIKNSRIVHIGTGRPAFYRKVKATAKGKIIALDPGQELSYVYDEDSFRELVEGVDYLFLNDVELELAMKYLGIGRKEELLEHAKVIVHTMGENGSELLTQNGPISIPAAKPEKVVETTGSGDSYRAGFYLGLSMDKSLEECGQLGAAAASYCVENKGAQDRIPSLDMVLERV